MVKIRPKTLYSPVGILAFWQFAWYNKKLLKRNTFILLKTFFHEKCSVNECFEEFLFVFLTVSNTQRFSLIENFKEKQICKKFPK